MYNFDYESDNIVNIQTLVDDRLPAKYQAVDLLFYLADSSIIYHTKVKESDPFVIAKSKRLPVLSL